MQSNILDKVLSTHTIKAMEALEGCNKEEIAKRIAKAFKFEITETQIENRWLDKYPMALQNCHIQEMLGVSEGKAYQIMRRTDCPTFRDGKRMVVPKDLFWKFISNEASKGTAFEGGVSL